MKLTLIAGTLVQLDLNAADASESRVLTRVMDELSLGAQHGPPVSNPPIDSSAENMDNSRTFLHSTDSSPTVVADPLKSIEDVTLLPAVSPIPTRSEPPMRKSSQCSQSSVCLPISRQPSVTPFDPPIIVLVVDDDRLTRTVMSRMLTRLGCTVSTAENGEIALELIMGRSSKTDDGGDLLSSSDSDPGVEEGQHAGNGSAFDLVFLDNQMPVMSGLETVSKLREIGRNDFVVGVTGQCCSRFVSFVILTLKQAMLSLTTRKNTPRRVWTSMCLPVSCAFRPN